MRPRFRSLAIFAGAGAVAICSCTTTHVPTKDSTSDAAADDLALDASGLPRDASDAASSAKLVNADSGGACPAEMVLAEGRYCEKPNQICKRWLDTGRFRDYRCAEYVQPATCVGKRENKRFCIDREEYVAAGDTLPLAHQSWTSASEVCKKDGKRLCLESEWQFACEGPDMHPYPYGDGFHRDATACNIDQMHLGKPNAGLTDLRAPISAYPNCVSVFGVHDMSGNIEEWATLDHGAPPQRSSMKGAWWLPGKNNCRAATLGHGEVFEGPQVGVRCCKEPAN